MTTVVPPPPPIPPTPTPALAPTVIVVNPPPALGQLSLGSLIEATVIGQETRGLFQANSPLGALLMQTQAPLPNNAALMLQLVSLVPQAQLQVISINSKPPHLGLRGQASAQPPPGAGAKAARQGGASTSAPSPLAALRTGAIITATLLRPPAALLSPLTAQPGAVGAPSPKVTPAAQAKGAATARPAAKGAAQARAGAPTARSAGATALRPAKSGAKGRPATLSPFPPAAARTTPQASSKGAARALIKGKGAAFPAGTQMSVKITSLRIAAHPGGGPGGTAKAASTPSGNLPLVTLGLGKAMTGTVTGSTSSGQPIVQTGAGALTLLTRTPVAAGSSVAFEIISKPLPPSPPPASPAGQSLLQSRVWPNLNEAMQVIQEANPGLAQQIVNTAMAQPNSQLAANMLFFLNALAGGNVFGWMGDGAMRTIQRFRPGLVEKLKDDFKLLGKMADKTSRGEWRVSLIPIYAGEGIEQIRMLTRRLGGDEDSDNEETEGTRFVIDVDLSRLGRLQLDGLAHAGSKRLDLIVRTDTPLPAEMRDNIREIFIDAKELTNIGGGLTFQAAPANFVELPPAEAGD
ncbi:MAG: hypothetical protein V3R66_05020, partial [Rhodospirillales bacterium]